MSNVPDETLNAQAVDVATTALSDSVVAATRCEQITSDNYAKAAGVGAATRGMARFSKKLGGAMMPSVGNMAKGLEGGGLPKTFVLAITADQIHALEDKQDGDKLVPGKVLKSWNREGFQAKLNPDMMNAFSAVPEDHQVLTLYLPLDDSKNRYLKAAASNMAAAGSPGMPTQFMIAKDPASEGVIDTLGARNQGATIAFGAGGMAQMGGAGATDSTAQLEKLAQMHANGVLTDAEFEAQKAKIIGG